MRVVYAIQAYSPAVGGAEWCTKNVCEQLVSRYGDSVTVFASAGYNCEVFARGGKQMDAGATRIGGVNVHRFSVQNPLGRGRYAIARLAHAIGLPGADRLRTFAAGPFLKGFERALLSSDVDVFAAGSLPYRHLYQTANCARKLKKPFVLNPCYHAGDGFWFGGHDQLALLKEADAYVANTEFERELAESMGIDSRRIFVAGNGVDIDRHLNANGSKIRRTLGIGGAPLVGFVGLHSKRKGLDLLIEAMRIVWSQAPETCLLIAGGRTNYTLAIKELVDSLPASESTRVRWLEDFSEADKAEVYAAIDVLAIPSRFESFGIVTLEAWAARKPVVAFRGGAIASVIEHGKDGRLAEAGQPESLATELLFLLQNPAERQALGAAGYRKTQARYSWPSIAGVYREAMAFAIRSNNNRAAALASG